MTAGKGTIAFAGRFAVPEHGIVVLVRKEGMFSPADIEGEWILPLEEAVFDMAFTRDGTLTKCAIVSGKDALVPCTCGLTVNTAGTVSIRIEVLKQPRYL